MAYEKILINQETARCLLCKDGCCSRACPAGLKPDAVIRSLRFENYVGAASKIPSELPCTDCREKACEKACLLGRADKHVRIKKLMKLAKGLEKEAPGKVDLSVTFCGIRCENPFFLSSSVVGSNYEMTAKAFEMGWAGVAFKTIGMFVPEEVSPRFDRLGKENNPFIGFKNIEQISDHTLIENLGYLKRLKKDYPTKVIIASVMGRTEEEWEKLAALTEEAGADIIECNFSCPHMSGNGLGSDVGTEPDLVARYTKAVKRGTSLPVLAKMTPNITNMELPARAAVEAGADGLAAINTIKSILNVDLDTFSSGPDVAGRSAVGGYSGKAVKPVALRFIQELKMAPGLENIPISGMGGIETWKDAAEFISLGCGTVQVTTAVMQYGYRIIDDLTDGLSSYLAWEGFSSAEELMGRALPNIVPAEELDRHSICYPKFQREVCVGCGRCSISCSDGGHQAVRMNDKTGKPVLDAGKCVGCHLCAVVCPVHAIVPGKRVCV